MQLAVCDLCHAAIGRTMPPAAAVARLTFTGLPPVDLCAAHLDHLTSTQLRDAARSTRSKPATARRAPRQLSR